MASQPAPARSRDWPIALLPPATVARWAERAFFFGLTFDMMRRMAPAVIAHPQLLLFFLHELVDVGLFLSQRRGSWTTEPRVVMIAFVGTFSSLLVVNEGIMLLPTGVSAVLMAVGTMIALAAKVCLGRSFGIIPANRGVKSGGIYSLVRHPMYAGYVISNLGFLLVRFSLWNVIVIALGWAAQWQRLLEEERFLSRDPAYRDLMRRVRHRIIPGLL